MVEQFKILDLQLWWGGRGPRHSSVYTPFYFHYSAPIPVLLPTTHHFYHHHQHHQHSHHNCRQINHYLHPFCHYHLCHGGNMLESHRNLHRNHYQCRHKAIVANSSTAKIISNIPAQSADSPSFQSNSSNLTFNQSISEENEFNMEFKICTLTRTRESYPKIPFLEHNMKMLL